MLTLTAPKDGDWGFSLRDPKGLSRWEIDWTKDSGLALCLDTLIQLDPLPKQIRSTHMAFFGEETIWPQNVARFELNAFSRKFLPFASGCHR